MSTVAVENKFTEVKQRVADAARKAGRRPEDVLLVAVTKYAEPDQIRELLDLGHRDLGENHVQQLLQRAAMLDEYLNRRRILSRTPGAGGGAGEGDTAAIQPRWHLIGPLQRNKAKKAVEVCRLIHTVDSLRVAEELQEIGLRREAPIDVLIQVNISGEASKGGCPGPAAMHLVAQIESMVYVRARGLMTMAPETGNPEDSRPIFGRCREMLEDISAEGFGDGKFNILSMGMSGDYEVAISEGANLVRVGSAIFG